LEQIDKETSIYLLYINIVAQKIGTQNICMSLTDLMAEKFIRCNRNSIAWLTV